MTTETKEPTREYTVEILPLQKAIVEYVKDFLSPGEAKILFDWCKGNLPFEQHDVKVFGKTFAQPRKTCVVGVGQYTYSGLTLSGTPLPECFTPIIDRMMLFMPAGHPRFNTVLCNYYADGNHHISPHSDKETDLDKSCSIVGLSLGATRHFDLTPKDKSTGEKKYRVDLVNGSIIRMGDECQPNYLHSVPVEKTVKEPRISLTFRVALVPLDETAS